MNAAPRPDGLSVAPRGVRITFHGGLLVPGLPKALTLETKRPISAGELVLRLEETTGVADLRAQVERYFTVLVDGTSIQHLQGWETIVSPGAQVSFVAPMGGGDQ